VSFSPPPPRPPLTNPALTRPGRGDAGRQPQDPNKLWLDKNENSDPELSKVTAEVLRSLPPSVLYAYPDQGPLYRKLAASLGVEPGQLLLTAGSDAAIRAVFDTYVMPGDAVIHPDPTFAMYPVYCQMAGARGVALSYQPGNDAPRLYAADIIAAIEKEKPKLVCLPNPDSPTGTVLAEDDLRAVIEVAGAASALMLVDEAYYPFYPKTVVSWIAEYPHLAVARTTAKAWGLAGLRLGYAVASPEVAMLLHKCRPMFEVNTLAVALFERLLDREDAMTASVARLTKGKETFLAAMKELGFRTHAGHGNFCHVHFAEKTNRIHAALADLVYYRNMVDPCLAGFSRFSSTTPERFAPVIERIRETVRRG
jgi:histidinol-phosphate aminotransferase